MHRAAIILSGCGVFDGSEITETILLMLCLDIHGIKYDFFAPNIMQNKTVNHLIQENTSEQRNCLIESARIARGSIRDLKELSNSEYSILVLPGGFGVTHNLSNHSASFKDFKIDPNLSTLIQSFHASKKPIAATCIAPILFCKCLSSHPLSLTLGNNAKYQNLLQDFNFNPIPAKSNQFIADDINLVYTSPAYMDSNATPESIYEGFSKMIKHISAIMKKVSL